MEFARSDFTARRRLAAEGEHRRRDQEGQRLRQGGAGRPERPHQGRHLRQDPGPLGPEGGGNPGLRTEPAGPAEEVAPATTPRENS